VTRRLKGDRTKQSSAWKDEGGEVQQGGKKQDRIIYKMYNGEFGGGIQDRYELIETESLG